MEKFNGQIETCKDAHNLDVFYDKEGREFFGFCQDCGFSTEITGDYIDGLFVQN